MALYNTGLASAAAAIDYTDLLASGQVLNGVVGGRYRITADRASRVAPGVADPVASTTAGISIAAGETVEVALDADNATQSIWVQTLADQAITRFEIHPVGAIRSISA